MDGKVEGRAADRSDGLCPHPHGRGEPWPGPGRYAVRRVLQRWAPGARLSVRRVDELRVFEGAARRLEREARAVDQQRLARRCRGDRPARRMAQDLAAIGVGDDQADSPRGSATAGKSTGTAK